MIDQLSERHIDSLRRASGTFALIVQSHVRVRQPHRLMPFMPISANWASPSAVPWTIAVCGA